MPSSISHVIIVSVSHSVICNMCAVSDRTINTGGTPSNDTGPSSDAGGGANYVYTEVSGLTYPVAQNFILETTNFRELQQIEFAYHMFGATMGTLRVELFDGNVWDTIFTRTGQQQATSAEAHPRSPERTPARRSVRCDWQGRRRAAWHCGRPRRR